MSEGLPSIFETVESSAELMEYYNARIEAFKLTDPEFAEVVEPLLSFEQVEFVLKSMDLLIPFCHLDDSDGTDNLILNIENKILYPKIPIVILKNGKGIKFIDKRSKIIDKNHVFVDINKFSTLEFEFDSNEFLCCISPKEMFETYKYIASLNSLEYELVKDLLSAKGINSDIFDIFVLGSHTTISIPTGSKIGLATLVDFKAHSYIPDSFCKNYPRTNDYLELLCDYIGSQKIDPNICDIDHSRTFIGEQIIDPTNNISGIQFWRTGVSNDGVYIPSREDKSGYFEWCMSEIKKLFYDSLKFNGSAFLKNSDNKNLIAVAFKDKPNKLSKIRRDL
jgi:hypothetical protein